MKQLIIEAGVLIVLGIAMIAIKLLEPFAGCIEYAYGMKNRAH